MIRLGLLAILGAYVPVLNSLPNWLSMRGVAAPAGRTVFLDAGGAAGLVGLEPLWHWLSSLAFCLLSCWEYALPVRRFRKRRNVFEESACCLLMRGYRRCRPGTSNRARSISTSAGLGVVGSHLSLSQAFSGTAPMMCSRSSLSFSLLVPIDLFLGS